MTGSTFEEMLEVVLNGKLDKEGPSSSSWPGQPDHPRISRHRTVGALLATLAEGNLAVCGRGSCSQVFLGSPCLGVHAWEGRSAQVEVDDQRRSWGVRDQVKDEEADNILQRDLPDPWQSRSPRKKEVTQQRRILGVLYLLGTCTRL